VFVLDVCAMSEAVHKRAPKMGKREVRRVLGVGLVAEAIGAVDKGCEIFMLTDGTYSLVHVLLHVLQATGPVDLVISTWTVAIPDMVRVKALMDTGEVLSCRWILDFSFAPRGVEKMEALRELFGDEAIRLTKSHAKFCVLRNADWDVVIRTSMNLNENHRTEFVEISDDLGLADYLAGFTDRMFSTFDGKVQIEQKPYDTVKDFHRFVADGQDLSDAELERRALAGERGHDINEGRYANDMRKPGATWTQRT
jgi:hypothetical protein